MNESQYIARMYPPTKSELLRILDAVLAKSALRNGVSPVADRVYDSLYSEVKGGK